MMYQNFANLQKDKNFKKKVVLLSLVAMVPVLNVLVFLYAYLFMRDSMENRNSRLPSLSCLNWKVFRGNVEPIALFSVYYSALVLISVFSLPLVSYFSVFLLVPSAFFSAVLYAYTGDVHSFFDLRRIFLFWKHNFYELIIPSGMFLLSEIVVCSSPFYCLSMLSVLAGIFLCSTIVNLYDEDLYL